MIAGLSNSSQGEAAKRICIVTPDVIGPIRNGGIGTHAYYLALSLADVHAVTILFTGPIEHETYSHWQSFYRDKNVDFVHLNEVESPVESHADWFIKRSYVVYKFLRDKAFDFIHFQEWQANGLHCILAKQTTQFFQNTTLTVDMHSSSEWINEGMNKWGHWPVPDAKLEWCERYCCQFADILISPTQYMYDYCELRRWQLSDDKRVLRNCFDQSMAEEPSYKPDLGVLAFFGRLETRKGLELFLSAIEALDEESRAKIKKIYFIGKSGWLTGAACDAYHYIVGTMQRLNLQFEIHTQFDATTATNFIRSNKALVVIPSLVDNYPYTIVEAQMHGIPVIASDTGGIAELLEEDRLFKPTIRDAVAKLKTVLRGDIPTSRGKYDAEQSAKDWLALHELPVRKGRREAAVELMKANPPFVSICVPYYNYGQYLEPMVRALQSSTYKNFEVVIVNDGSTDAASVAKFEELKQSCGDDRFIFLSKENGGIGVARNYAASHAKGEFLIFCDADNCSTPEMVEEFVLSILMTGGDAVSCNFKIFAETTFWPDETTKIEGVYLPIGAALEVGMVVNVFGDANSIIRKSAFEAIGGFQTERHTSWEDWDLLARLCLAGYRLDVCPQELFWYRHTDAGFSRNTSIYQNHMRILKAYADYGPAYMGPLVRNLLVPLHYAMDREHQIANRLSRSIPPVHAKNKAVTGMVGGVAKRAGSLLRAITRKH